HYGTTIIPARVRRPRDKAKVENAVQQVERWVLAPLRHQRFFSVAEANQAIRARLDWLNDRPLSRLAGTRRSLWRDLDRPALRPLPPRRFDIPTCKTGVGVHTIGPAPAAVVRQILERRPHPEQGFRSCLGILSLARRHDAARVEQACRRAHALGAASYRSVKSILTHGLDRQPLPAPPTGPAPAHEHIRGPAYYHAPE